MALILQIFNFQVYNFISCTQSLEVSEKTQLNKCILLLKSVMSSEIYILNIFYAQHLILQDCSAWLMCVCVCMHVQAHTHVLAWLPKKEKKAEREMGGRKDHYFLEYKEEFKTGIKMKKVTSFIQSVIFTPLTF